MGARIRLLALPALLSAAVCLTVGVGAAGGAGRAGSARLRSLPVALSPGPGDLSLLAIRFSHPGARPIDGRSVRLAVSGPFGSDFLGIAAPRRGRGQPVLAVVANRVSAALDPATVRLRVLWAAPLGTPRLRRLADPLSRPVAHADPALCTLTKNGVALVPQALRSLGARGAPIAGFGTAAAVAEAYDAACGLPVVAGFRRALAGSGVPCQEASGCSPQPEPAPPTTEAPKCAPCDPTPGRACPLTARIAFCVAAKDQAASSAAAVAH
jgi:hypothetical protein